MGHPLIRTRYAPKLHVPGHSGSGLVGRLPCGAESPGTGGRGILDEER